MSIAIWIGLAAGAVVVFRLFFYDRVEQRLRRRNDVRPSCDGDWLRRRVGELLEPSLLLLPGSSADPSKFSGEPNLPSGMAWPSPAGSPLMFLAQIDLPQAKASGGPDWLPEAGSLFAFYDPEALGDGQVIHILHSRESPAIETVGSPSRRFAEQRVTFRRVISAPNRLWLGVEHHRVEDDDPKAWHEIIQRGDAPENDAVQHRVGGYPNEIQDEQMPLICEHLVKGLPRPEYQLELTPELEQAADSWRLLLQIDSDRELGMNWGAGGRLYVLVRKEDARAGDFSKTVSLWQTY